jgi:phage-related protein
MAATSVFEDLKKALNDLNAFLDANVGTVKPVVKPLNDMTGGKVTELIDKLIDLLNDMKTEIDKLSGQIPGLSEFTKFTQSVKGLLDASKALLPGEAGTIKEIEDVANVVIGLPSIDTLKASIKELIDKIVAHLKNLKS